MELIDLKKNFGEHLITAEFMGLLKFQELLPEYSEGFYLDNFDKSKLKAGWSSDPDFLKYLLPFARANGSGSFYALWDNGSGQYIDEMPVVVFGDEGGEFVVASKMSELLQLLTLDCEISVDATDGAYFYADKDADDEGSENAKYYRDWLKKAFDIDPIKSNEEADEIVKQAEDKYSESFNNWKKKYINYE